MIPMIIMAIEDEDDRSFMANLYVDYQRLMYKVITSHTTDPWDADDIFQSTLPKLIDKLADLRRMSKDPRLLLEENDEDVEALHRAWKRLDPRSQYLLEARYILNKSFEEIAADINIQPDSVRAALSRARKKARKLILEEKAL